MGQIEERIKAQLMLDIFGSTAAIYDLVESRFDIDEKRDEFITLLNNFNGELSEFLKGVRLT